MTSSPIRLRRTVGRAAVEQTGTRFREIREIFGPISRTVATYWLLVWLSRAFADSSDSLVLLTDVTNLALPFAAAAALWRLLPLTGQHTRSRRAWFLLGLGYLVVALADVGWVYSEHALDIDPSFSAFAYVYALRYPVILLALLFLFPKVARRPIDRIKLSLDAVIVSTVGAAFLWYFLLAGPLTDAAGRQAPVEELLAILVQPLGDAMIVFGMSALLMRLPGGCRRRAIILLCAASSSLLCGDAVWTYLSIRDEFASNDVADAFWTLDYVLVTMAADAERSRLLRYPADTASESRPTLSFLPYAALAALCGLLLVATAPSHSLHEAGIVVALAFGTGLVIARQIVGAREVQQLLEEKAARAGAERLGALVENASDGILIIGADGRITYSSPSAGRMLNRAVEDMSHRTIADLVQPEDHDGLEAARERARARRGSMETLEIRAKSVDGHARLIEVRLTNLLHDPLVGGMVLNLRDITENKELEAQLRHQAFHDPLTGLANRTLLMNRIEHALSRAARLGRYVAVLFLDLDDFKAVNDRQSHAFGDALLIAVAVRLRRAVREDATVARMGGDEFAVVLEDVRGSDEVLAVAEQVIAAMGEPFTIEDCALRSSASIGIAMSSPGDCALVLLRSADLAMYSAKSAGGGKYATFDQEMFHRMKRRVDLTDELKVAIRSNALRVYYQPIMDTNGNCVYGLEALARWPSENGDPRRPDEFIPLAESAGLIHELGEWVLHRAMLDAGTWMRRLPPDRVPLLSVNVSAHQVQDPAFAKVVASAIESLRFPAEKLVLELTESALMGDQEQALRTLERLRALGVQIAIDDFGTGYSSLHYLGRFPLDVLKIPKPFVEDLATHADRARLARAIQGIADSLEVRTVAEGVETRSQVEELLRIGCHLMQGYYFARPMDADETRRMLFKVNPSALHHGLTQRLAAMRWHREGA